MSTPVAAKKITVIVLAYNGERFLETCLASVQALNYSPHDVRVIVVDNASTDRSADIVVEKFPSVTLIRNPKNDGFAGGNNIAIRRALEDGADYVYLLNQDASLAPDALTEAVRVAEADERIGSVQSMLLLAKEPERINSAGNAIHFLGLGYATGYRVPLAEWPHHGIPEIAYASGACVLYRADALHAAGLFDEELFLYHEDLDLGWRIRLAGFGNVLAPHSFAYHDYEFSRSITKYYFMERNRFIVLLKNFRVWTLVLLSPFLLAAEVALFLAAFAGGWWKEKLQVYRYFFDARVWRHIARERAKVILLRTVGDREIVRLFTPIIAFQDVTGPFTTYVANPLMRVVWAVIRIFII